MNQIYRREHATFISIQSIDPGNRKVKESNINRHRFHRFTRIKDKKDMSLETGIEVGLLINLGKFVQIKRRVFEAKKNDKKSV